MDQPPPDIQDQPPPSTEADGEAHYAVPNLIFENRSGLEALQFDTVDQFGAAFHIVVVKAAYVLGPRGPDGRAPLIPAAVAAPLAVEDRHVGDDPAASVLQENDFAPYKPRCDVIVNATAHAPGGRPVRRFLVGLTVARPAQVATEPDSPTTRAPVAPAEQQQELRLIHKPLYVHGERQFKRKWAPWRLTLWLLKVASLGLLRVPPWRLTRSSKFTQLPLHYDFAQGGQCRIDANDPDARYVPRKARLPVGAGVALDATSAAEEPSGKAVAHEACQSNPIGRSFTRRWYLDAKRPAQLPAPRIATAAQPCSASQFWAGACGRDLPEPAGFGCIGRAWLPRRALAGAVEEKSHWQADEVPGLPADFDFAYWNSAPRDQQCQHLCGQESVTLTNLCDLTHPSASIGADGDTLLRFRLPRQVMALMLLDSENKVAKLRLVMDTLFIEPEASRVELVWRVAIEADGDFHTARLLHLTEPAQIQRLQLLESLRAQGEPGAANDAGDARQTAGPGPSNNDTAATTLAKTD